MALASFTAVVADFELAVMRIIRSVRVVTEYVLRKLLLSCFSPSFWRAIVATARLPAMVCSL